MAPRIQNVSVSGFSLRIQEQESGGPPSGTESVNWIAWEQGSTGTSDPFAWETQTPSVTHVFSTVSFAETYSQACVLAEMNSFNGGDPATLRYQTLSTAGVDLQVDEESSADAETGHVCETLGVVAIECVSPPPPPPPGECSPVACEEILAQAPYTLDFESDHGKAQDGSSHTVTSEFFSFDGAGNDPRIGTRTFGGIFTSFRNGPGPLEYSFEDLSLTAEEVGGPPPPPPGDVSFIRTSFSVANPTAMAWGPDDRLYVTELFGEIHALTLTHTFRISSTRWSCRDRAWI